MKAAFAAVALSGCTMVSHVPTAGWPQLLTVEHFVSQKEMRDRCTKYAGLGLSPIACAEFDLAKGTCDIWHSGEFPPTEAVREHELLHCQGFDHVAGGMMAKAVKAWKGVSSK